MAAFGVEDIRDMYAQQNVIFFIGDTQVHAVSDRWLNGMTPWVVERDIVNATLSDILRHWRAEEVFFTPGNNDGPHNSIFVRQDNGTVAWARVLIDNNIVTNSLGWNYTRTLSGGEELKNVSQVDFFQHTGYYVKKLPYLRGLRVAGGDTNQWGGVYAIITNTNLGLHHFDQMQALYDDLERIERRQGVAYLLGHHPWIAPKMVPSRYQHVMRGVLSGHIHQAETTTPPPHLFTQVPAISQNAEDTAFYIAKISSSSSSSSSSDYQYRISVDYNRDLFVYQGKSGEAPSSAMWQLRDQAGSPKNRHHLQKLMIIIIASVAALALLSSVVIAIVRCKRQRHSQWDSVNNLESSAVEEVRTDQLPHQHLRQHHQTEQREEEEEEATLGSPLTSNAFSLQNQVSESNAASQ